jgi:HEAT repeat protein
LLRTFRDRDHRAREEATAELVRLGRPAADALALKLNESDEAGRALVAMGVAAVPSLVERGTDLSRAAIAWKAASLLVKIGEAAVTPIVERIAAENGSSRSDALVFALGELGTHSGEQTAREIVPCLVEVLRHGEMSARLMAVIALEKNAAVAEKAAPVLVHALEDWAASSARVASQAGVTGDHRREELRQFGERLCEHSVAALVRIGRPAVPSLIAAWRLHAGEEWAEESIGRALETISTRDPGVLPLLVGTVEGRRAGVANVGDRRGGVGAALVLAAPAEGPADPDDRAGEGGVESQEALRRRFLLIGVAIACTVFVLLFLAFLFDV